MDTWIKSAGLISAGLFAVGLGIVAFFEEREMARAHARHVHAFLQSRLFLFLGFTLDLALIGGGLLTLGVGVSRLLKML